LGVWCVVWCCDSCQGGVQDVQSTVQQLATCPPATNPTPAFWMTVVALEATNNSSLLAAAGGSGCVLLARNPGSRVGQGRPCLLAGYSTPSLPHLAAQLSQHCRLSRVCVGLGAYLWRPGPISASGLQVCPPPPLWLLMPLGRRSAQTMHGAGMQSAAGNCRHVTSKKQGVSLQVPGGLGGRCVCPCGVGVGLHVVMR
jgi:hypothetical protein